MIIHYAPNITRREVTRSQTAVINCAHLMRIILVINIVSYVSYPPLEKK